ncbi:uracil-DNA glycosylase [Acetobacter cibinongensis]|uniref:Type-4 uracil-DNA glycosylase n=1 Tax=Acetobacter cibinongensis TaxID=146475 RepID=A0A0D6N578_9PROT|nr:UdgX family uracil-DNA binding protein [Acetobacter cibinongensis]GAN60728.1 phage DNA polymerase [Acetobacter cibinongensis]GBQ11993.1 phage DNA polymerase-like protein [Acetobacter cibinongensis NRIC 0482]GEL58759.1 uracil-DNA glycosylase [Acetobacter cibinongensis]
MEREEGVTHIVLAHEVDFATWRQAVRYHVSRGTRPEELSWSVLKSADIFGQNVSHPVWKAPEAGGALTLPRSLVERLVLAIQVQDPDRFSRLYKLVYRVVHEGLDLQQDNIDSDRLLVDQWVTSIKQESAAFRQAFAAHYRNGGRDAWYYEPHNYILEANAAFCRARVAERWAVHTPYRSMQWDGRALFFGEGGRASSLWQPDAAWPWEGYPNTVLIPTETERQQAETLDQLGAEAMDCRSCALWKPAQRTVFGEGPGTARIMVVGEQPGDQEDKAGHPFVGPAGQVFDSALRDAALTRSDVYVTNAVKHFRFTWRGSHRLHQKPEQENITACRPWLDAERRLVKPELIVMMGVTAAQSLLGRPVTISRERSRIFDLGPSVQGLVTVHPSYLLRLPNQEDKQREYARFVEDLKLAQHCVTVKL